MLRPRRSALFMPGVNARAMEKARALDADVLIFDLEDSVAPDAKIGARDRIAAALAQGGYGTRELILRVNGADTAWQRDDLAFAMTQPIGGVLLPKVLSGDEVRAVEAILDGSGAKPDLRLWCMMETPLAFLHAEAIASASPRLAALVVGTEDLGKDIHARARPDRLPFLTALQLCVLAARAYGLAPLDAVYPDFDDTDGFAASCHQGRDLGFEGRTLIHPKQIAIANAAFGPGEDELAAARRIVEAFGAAKAAGKGIATLDGKMVEYLHAESAQRLLDTAAMIAARKAETAR
jgi:citrate lyase subunit beta/citryl-CoA lyase